MKNDNNNRYVKIIEYIFFSHYVKGTDQFEFEREQVNSLADELGIERVRNMGDLIYYFRYRNPLPDRIRNTAEPDQEWIIEGAGRGRYRFKQTKINRILPRGNLLSVKVPDATPEIIRGYALNDEQATLAKIRYNRLIDIFLGITAYSLQNHLRTTVKDIGQIEIDEIYVGLDKLGRQFVVPVQAKGGNDQHAVVQTTQDIRCCAEKFPNLICRAVSAQNMGNDQIALLELLLHQGELKVVEERHYQLVPATSITDSDLALYARSTS